MGVGDCLKILYTAFNGKSNSSKILLDNINEKQENKLYLKNSFKTSVEQLLNKIKDDNYDLIISFGQARLNKGVIKIETQGKDMVIYKTDFDYFEIKKKLEKNNFKVVISNDAGNYFCNNIYYNGLKYINNNKLKTKMIFIHIPEINNIEDINKLAKLF